jgi:hypothetical protein
MADMLNAANNLGRAEQTRLHRQQIEQERAQRIARHKQAIAARKLALVAAPGAPRTLNLFADGDSWFDYPLPVLTPNDTITSIGKHGTPKPLILNLAHYGDEARDDLGVHQRERIRQNLTDRDNGTFDAILFSGGGNDTVGDQFCLWIQDAQSRHQCRAPRSGACSGPQRLRRPHHHSRPGRSAVSRLHSRLRFRDSEWRGCLQQHHRPVA